MATESIEIPIFTGDDLRQWIDWLINFFEREQFTDDDDKLNFTQSFMEGEARAWFIQRAKMMIFGTWDELKRSLLIRFGSYDDPERIKILREQDQRWKTLTNSWNHSNEIAESSSPSLQIEFPVFDGFMPYCWIRKVERVFRAVKYSEEEKLDLVHVSLEGDARNWYSEEVIKGEFITWFSFKKRLLARFAPEENGSHSNVSTHVPEIVQDLVLKSAKVSSATLEMTESMKTHDLNSNVCVPEFQHVESTSNEALQAASETCFSALPESYYGLVLEVLPYGIGSDGLCVQDGEEPYILQVHTEDELTPPSIDSESLHYVPTLVNKKFLRDKTREHTRKQRLSPKSWRFKYKKRMEMSVNSQLWGLTRVNAIRVGWLQKRQNSLLLRNNVSEGDILVEKINGMGSVANDVSGFDALVQFSDKNDAGLNKKKTKRYHQTRDVRDKEATTVDYAEVQRFSDVLLTHSDREQIQHRKRCYKTWHFKYKDERMDFLSFKFTQKSGVTEKWESLPLNLPVWYFAMIDKGDHFAIWHCWKERKLMQSRELSLYLSPANGIMKIMGLEIQVLRVEQVVDVFLHKSRVHDYVIGLSGDATLERSLTLLSQFIKEDVQKTKFCKDWGFKYKAATKLVYRKFKWTSKLLQDVVIHFRNEVTLALHHSFRRNHAPRHTQHYSPSRMLHYKATRKRIQLLSLTTERAIQKHSSAIWHKWKSKSSYNGTFVWLKLRTYKDIASMLLMTQTVLYLSEVFHLLQSSSTLLSLQATDARDIVWLALPIAAASQIEDSCPNFSPLKLGVKLVKRRGVLIRLMTWRLTWKFQRILYLMERFCR
ncbi:hypothetical protein N665_1021s0004 [Sinapis alba]|nr:hypothetical protein N665_1021s0004 [Sinapis alba]